MEFRNLTPFDVMCFSALDLQHAEHPVIAMKVGYRLQPVGETLGQFSAVVMDRDPLPLCRADRYWGEAGHSSGREESDLAPVKPRCDVIINGHAHAPGGNPTEFWEAGVRLTAPALRPVLHVDPPKPWRPGAPLTQEQLYAWRDAKREAEHRMATAPRRQVFLDKHLRFCGPRRFEKRFFGWSLTDPEPALSVPLQWEYAFGGSSLIYTSLLCSALGVSRSAFYDWAYRRSKPNTERDALRAKVVQLHAESRESAGAALGRHPF